MSRINALIKDDLVRKIGRSRTNTLIANDVTRKIFRGLVLLPIMKVIMRKNFDRTFHINCSNHAVRTNILDLVTVACNNEYTIEHQYRLLNKYLTDPFHYTVADNSSSPIKQQSIFEMCHKAKIAYIRLPSNPLTMTGFANYSHGMACNWLYNNYIEPRAAPYFGFLDHDIYPIKRTSIVNILENQPVFGRREPLTVGKLDMGDVSIFTSQFDASASVWWLKVGFSFFRRDYVLGKVMDFTPNKGWDAGFSNWGSIYSKIDPATIEFPMHISCKLQDSNGVHVSQYEIIDDWIHTGNASYWAKGPSKETLIESLLEQY